MKNFGMRFLAVLGLTMFITTPAYADLSVSFNEGAPKDRFSFKNVVPSEQNYNYLGSGSIGL